MSLYKFDISKDWMDERNKAAARGDKPAAEQAERYRNQKIDILGLNLPKTYDYIDLGDELEADMQSGKSPQEVYQKAMLRQNKAKNSPGLSQYAYDDIQKRAMHYYTDGMSSRPTYENKRQTTIDDLWERVVNAPEFSYNADSDPVYQSYKDMYTREGQRAMQDTLAALSIDAGGENSWAVSAAAQAQNRYMQELADKVPELYNLAYDRYMTERNADVNKLALARDMENTDYGRYLDDMNIYQTDRGYYDMQMDKWNAEAQAYKTDAENKVWTLVQAGETPSDELLVAAGITDKEQIKNMAETNKSVIGYELAGMDIENKMNSLALQEALGQLGGNNYKYYGPTGPEGKVSEVEKKAASFTSDEELVSYLGGLVENGTITEEEGDRIYAKYANNKFDNNVGAAYKDMVGSAKDWEVVDDGGRNGFWGIDNNAIVKAPNGEPIRLDNLLKKLVDEGMDESAAKEMIITLQKNLGI